MSMPAPIQFQKSNRHGMRGADVFSYRWGKLIAELGSAPCPAKPASCNYTWVLSLLQCLTCLLEK